MTKKTVFTVFSTVVQTADWAVGGVVGYCPVLVSAPQRPKWGRNWTEMAPTRPATIKTIDGHRIHHAKQTEPSRYQLEEDRVPFGAIWGGSGRGAQA